MKRLILLVLFLIFSKASFAFTLNNNTAASFAGDEVLINVASNTDCSATGLTNDEILSLAVEGAELFWNRVATSKLKLRKGSLTSVSGDFETDSICSSGVNTSCVPNSNLSVASGILVACNTNASNFSNSSYVMAVALPNNLSGNTINGALILINGTGSTSTNSFGNRPRSEQVSIMAHEIGHAVGLGHSGVTDSLMYYESIDSREALGWDDIQGITYLYPREQPVSCSSITYDFNKLGPSLLIGLLTVLLLFNWKTKVNKFAHR